jgi:hypothetical protein
VKAARFLPPLLAGATLILIGANALPTAHRKHRLQEERLRLVRELREEQDRTRVIAAEIEALQADPFYIERVLIETWGGAPEGAQAFYAEEEAQAPPIED